MIEETTQIYPLWDRLRFRYFERGHKCGIKVKKQNESRRIRCDCSVSYARDDRLWWRIVTWLAK